MARNVKHSGKPSGSAQIESGEPFGTTFQRSTTHAPELRAGVSKGKTSGKIAPNGIMCGPTGGATFTVNKPAVDFPSAGTKPKASKVIDSRATGSFEPGNTVAKEATGVASSDPLKASYEKKGRKDSTRGAKL